MKAVTVGAGSRSAVVVHGNDLCGEHYRPLADALATHGLRSTLLTLPGFHDVAPLAEPGWRSLADAVVDALPDDDGVLIGHSMGGLIALLAAAGAGAGRLSHLVLLEPAVFPSRTIALLAAARYLQTVVRAAPRGFVNSNGGMRRIHDPARYPPAALALHLEVRARSDRRTAEALFSTVADLYPLPFERVAVPALVVAGAASGWRARAMVALVGRRLGAELAVVPGAAHWLVHERDAEVARAIAGFVGCAR